ELWACGAAPGRGRYGADRRGERRVGGERLRPDGARRVPRGSGRRVGPGDAGAWDPTARSSPGTVTPAAYHPPRGQLPISPVLAGGGWGFTAWATANVHAHGDGPGRVGGLPCGARESSSALPVRSATAEVCRITPCAGAPAVRTRPPACDARAPPARQRRSPALWRRRRQVGKLCLRRGTAHRASPQPSRRGLSHAEPSPPLQRGLRRGAPQGSPSNAGRLLGTETLRPASGLPEPVAGAAADRLQHNPRPSSTQQETMRMDRDLERWRADTPGVASGVIHLNNAGASLMPRPGLEAGRAHLELEARIGGYEAADAARAEIAAAYESVARLVGAAPRNIAMVENATVAFFQALAAFDFAPGDVILTTRNDYISNQLAYLSLHHRAGVRVVRAEDLPEGGVDPESV